MKVFALVALLAVAAYASAEDVSNLPTPAAEHFLGLFQEMEGGPIVSIGDYHVDAKPDLSGQFPSYFSIPSCKMGPTWGNPVCLAKCISRGHIAGFCLGAVCKCVG